MTPQAIQNLQLQLGLPQTGVFDAATSAAYTNAVSKSLASNPDYATYGAGQDPASILNAYQTGDWSGVTTLTGKPFTDEQQQAAVAQSKAALDPAYQAQVSKDTADVTDNLNKTKEGLSDFENSAATNFTQDKNTLDKSAADNGILFSGARVQKQNDLRNSYQSADAIQRRNAGEAIASTGRNFQYQYGDDAAKNLSSLYAIPGGNNYNASVANGPVTRSSSLSSAYDPSKVNYQGTAPVAQQTNIQTRAATLLANKANKLSLSGLSKQF